MNELKIFENKEFGKVRAIDIKGEAWLVGKDIAEILGYSKPLNAIAQHVDEDDSLKQGITDSLGREQQTIVINESGLYSLIFGSQLARAKEFKHWVTNEVLPSIRKHGAYVSENLSPQLQLLINMELKQKELETSLFETKEEVQAIRDTIIINPKAEWRKETNRLLTKMGVGLNDFANARNEAYKALEIRAHCRPKILIENLKLRALKNGMSQSKVDDLCLLDVLENETRLREIYINIVKEMAIKYKIV